MNQLISTTRSIKSIKAKYISQNDIVYTDEIGGFILASDVEIVDDKVIIFFEKGVNKHGLVEESYFFDKEQNVIIIDESIGSLYQLNSFVRTASNTVGKLGEGDNEIEGILYLSTSDKNTMFLSNASNHTISAMMITFAMDNEVFKNALFDAVKVIKHEKSKQN